ncbi:MAG: fatty acid desaturase [Candidatus Solibacter usitatus]|nr:fatty acid desaturase [Candidatus Solibacter usitatus]
MNSATLSGINVQIETATSHRINRINWVTTIALALFHVGAIASLFYLNWKSVAVAAVLYWMCIGWGIGMGYHRLLTHRSYRVPRFLEYLFAVCGALTLEGGPIFWVATHRVHHQRSDQPGDPHSPRDGSWWSHLGWIIFGETQHNATGVLTKYAPDLGKDPFYRWLNTYHYVPLIVLGLILLGFGGLSMMLWGICTRVVIGLHATWLVNSASHIWGGRRFQTRDDSRNNWWVAALTFGEGWHNNHHAHPTSARHGLAWFEFDPTWLQIKFLSLVGLARKVQVARVQDKMNEDQIAAA